MRKILYPTITVFALITFSCNNTSILETAYSSEITKEEYLSKIQNPDIRKVLQQSISDSAELFLNDEILGIVSKIHRGRGRPISYYKNTFSGQAIRFLSNWQVGGNTWCVGTPCSGGDMNHQPFSLWLDEQIDSINYTEGVSWTFSLKDKRINVINSATTSELFFQVLENIEHPSIANHFLINGSYLYIKDNNSQSNFTFNKTLKNDSAFCDFKTIDLDSTYKYVLMNWYNSSWPLRFYIPEDWDVESQEIVSPASPELIREFELALKAWSKYLKKDLVIVDKPPYDVLVTWAITNEEVAELGMKPNTLAVAELYGYRPNRYIRRRIAFNVDSYDFSYGRGEPGTYDYQTVAIHELGHILGLDHERDPFRNAVMYPNVTRTTIYNSIYEDDYNGIKARYGSLIVGPYSPNELTILPDSMQLINRKQFHFE